MPYRLSTILTFSFVLVVFAPAMAQQIATIALEEAIAAALENNSTIKLALADEHIAEANYQQSNSAFLPQVGLSYTAMTSNSPINVFGYKLQQQSITVSDFDPQLLTSPSSTPNYMASIDMKQPLINVDQVFLRKGAQKQVQAAQFRTLRTKESITFEVKKAYFQLQLAYQAVAVMEETLESVKATYTFTENRFNNGLLQKSDLLNVEIQVRTTETQLAEAKSQLSNASGHLSLLMGKPSDTIYKADVPIDEASAAPMPYRLPSDRADFRAMQNAIEASAYGAKSSQMGYLPRINAFGSYQLIDSEWLGFGSNFFLAGIQLSWDIFTGGKTRNYAAARHLERDKAEEQFNEQKAQGQLELDKAQRQLTDTQYAIQQQKTAVAHAEEVLRILQNRYHQGLANTTDALLAHAQVAQQKLKLAQALFSYQVTSAYINYLISSPN